LKYRLGIRVIRSFGVTFAYDRTLLIAELGADPHHSVLRRFVSRLRAPPCLLPPFYRLFMPALNVLPGILPRIRRERRGCCRNSGSLHAGRSPSFLSHREITREMGIARLPPSSGTDARSSFLSRLSASVIAECDYYSFLRQRRRLRAEEPSGEKWNPAARVN